MSHLVLDEMKQLKSLHIKVCCPDIYRGMSCVYSIDVSSLCSYFIEKAPNAVVVLDKANNEVQYVDVWYVPIVFVGLILSIALVVV